MSRQRPWTCLLPGGRTLRKEDRGLSVVAIAGDTADGDAQPEVAGVSVTPDAAPMSAVAATASAPIDQTLRPLKSAWDPNANVAGIAPVPEAASAAIPEPPLPAALPDPLPSQPALSTRPMPLPFFSSPTAVASGANHAVASQKLHPPVVRGHENHPSSIADHGHGKEHEKRGR